ncbi:c-type cytochrome [Desulfuromonas versatilis]|uniref:C-type cytochrome n=1 Tax=Desulfuromonas versatilis TaxID=2802975 RepID=A0ABM8HV26_9BACT|nr:cytochrome C [Desulfuromonas versatilis]BCR05772.1 c-type cytochrome [Desulfuromonas versatilis]
MVFLKKVSGALAIYLLLVGPVFAKPLRNVNASGVSTANGNLHDMSADNATNPVHADTETQVCIFCHTPHGASAQSALWNRGENAGAYPLYGNGTANIAIIDDPTASASSGYGANYPNGASRMCLSCHDGVTAVGNVLVGGAIDMVDIDDNPISTLADLPGADPLVDKKIVDLALSHPVSFRYDAAVRADINNYHTVAATGKSYGYDIVAGINTPLDAQDRMQCTTCHDPHNDNRAENASGLPFWRNPSAADPYLNVCDNCHAGGVIFGNSHNM